MYNNKFGYKELWELRDQNQYLSEANQFLKDEFLSIHKKRQNAVYSNLNMLMHKKWKIITEII